MKKSVLAIDHFIQWVGRAFLLAILLSAIWVIYHRVMPPKETVLMGVRHHEGMTVDARWVPISEISPHLIRAVIAAEDTKFCDHFGFDVEQIKAAMAEAEAGGRLRGASTISQQTAKNVFLWPGRGPVRKGAEAWFTLLLELTWSKENILETYLNVAEWGDGLFGAEAAAQKRFGKSARDLTAKEASLLAAVLPNPNKWRVTPPGAYVSQRSRTLRGRMATIREQGIDACAYSN